MNKYLNKKAYGGEIVPPKKVVKDKRTSGQILSVNPIEELGHTIKRPIPVNTGEMKYSKSNDPEYNNARKDFVNWYSNPETKERFVKNTGYDSGRLYDMMSKATAIPSHKGDAYKQPPVGTKAVFTTPDTGKKEEIVYHGGIGTGPIQHELTHAGAMANIIGPSLLRTLGSPTNQKLPSDINDPNFKSTSNSVKDYMSIPEEAYGNFHEFRVNLGLKPGEQIDIDTLRQKVKDKNLQQENFYNTFEDQKIVDAINKIAYNDNTNTNNIQQAAMGGNINNNLNQFDEGGTHEENPLGGIPMGQNASVEEGETMKGNFVYSDRVVLSPEIVSQMGLPKTFVGKTAADASKIINKKFEDRNDKISDSTKTSLLDKVAEAQEAVKAEQQAQLQQSMEANSMMAPEDQMQGQIPQGMEEYAQPQEMPLEQPQMAYGGRVKFFLGGLAGMGSSAAGSGLAGRMKDDFTEDPNGMIDKGMSTINNTIDIGKELFDKSKIDTSGLNDTPDQMVSMSNQALSGLGKGAKVGTMIMPGIGTAIGAGVGAISGIIGASKDKKALQQAQTNRQTRQFNTATSDFAMGGNIRKQYVEGGHVPPSWALKSLQQLSGLQPGDWGSNSEKALSAWQKSKGLTADGKYGPNTFKAAGLMNNRGEYTFPKPALVTDVEMPESVNNSVSNVSLADFEKANPTQPLKGTFLNRVGNAVKDNYGEALNYAPVASNLLQLKNLRKPEVVNAIRNDRRFQYDPADVRSQLNLAQSEMDNSVNALSNANMSQGALSNSILAANLNKNKVLSDAYFNADNQNRSMKMQEQSVNNALDEANIAREINAQDINAQNRGAYNSAKSKMIADLGTNLGKIGKGRTEDLMIRKMFGYTKSGNFYTKADGSIVSPEEMSKAMLAVKGIQTPETKAKGGYINNYKRF